MGSPCARPWEPHIEWTAFDRACGAPGIVAAVSGALAEREANILDISQTILQGIFTMTMLVELGESAEFSELKGKLDDLSESLGVQITLQREDVFRYMYRL